MKRNKSGKYILRTNDRFLKVITRLKKKKSKFNGKNVTAFRLKLTTGI